MTAPQSPDDEHPMVTELERAEFMAQLGREALQIHVITCKECHDHVARHWAKSHMGLHS